MASALRSFSRRRNLSLKWFCCKTSSTTIPPLVLHHDKDYNTKPTFPDSSLLLARRFHRQVFFEDRKKMSFAQASGVFLCRHISSSSSKPVEWSIKIDALGDVVEGLVPEKSVEAMSTTIDGCSSAAAVENFSFPVNFVHYVINGIHELTGCSWSMSIVLTAFLVTELMSPVFMRIQRQAAELNYWDMSIQKVMRLMQTCDPECLAKHKKWEAECKQKFGKCYKSYLPLSSLHLSISISFIYGINTMAKKIPGFTDLSTPDSFYILPLLTGLTYWLTRQATTISWTNILFRMKELPWFCLFFLVVQAAFRYEPSVYFYLISYRISQYTLSMSCRDKQVAKLRKALGMPYDPVASSEQQRIMARAISVMREFIDMVKKKDKK